MKLRDKESFSDLKLAGSGSHKTVNKQKVVYDEGLTILGVQREGLIPE